MINSQEFINYFKAAFENEQLVKLTLSKPLQKEAPYKNIYARRILVRSGAVVSWTFRTQTQDTVKNFPLEEALQQLQTYLESDFGIATLFTTQQDVYWEKGSKKLKIQAPVQVEKPSDSHDKPKNYLIAENSPFLQKLGISSAQGKVHAAHQDKFRQINKYVEIMRDLLPKATENEAIRIIDMGCGKGYLTFALYQYLSTQTSQKIQLTGIDLRPNLTELCNKTAQELGWNEHLNFITQDILDYNNSEIDVLIALHACDIATDIAIAKGIRAQAHTIVTAPCCHKQIRQQLGKQLLMTPILKHGILEERQAELLTDGIRALLLESKGYKTKVFEFISHEHTAKNVMITATKGEFSAKQEQECSAQIAQIKAQFGITEHYLEKLLAE